MRTRFFTLLVPLPFCADDGPEQERGHKVSDELMPCHGGHHDSEVGFQDENAYLTFSVSDGC